MAIIMLLITAAMYLTLPFMKSKKKRSYNAWQRSRKALNHYESKRNDDSPFARYILQKEL
jgi:hypothetical protein